MARMNWSKVNKITLISKRGSENIGISNKFLNSNEKSRRSQNPRINRSDELTNLTFFRSVKEFREIVSGLGYTGKWEERKNEKKWIYRDQNGAVFCWWPNTGTIHFQGRDTKYDMYELLKTALSSKNIKSDFKP